MWKNCGKLFLKLNYMKSQYVNINPNILGGTPVFMGTRVPVSTLFGHLAEGTTVEAFLEDFPTVTKEQAFGVLGLASKIFNVTNIFSLYENAA